MSVLKKYTRCELVTIRASIIIGMYKCEPWKVCYKEFKRYRNSKLPKITPWYAHRNILKWWHCKTSPTYTFNFASPGISLISFNRADIKTLSIKIEEVKDGE